MKTIKAFLSYLNSLNIKLWEENGQLRYNAPKGTMTAELRTQMAERKAEILTFLKQVNLATKSHLPPIQLLSRAENLPLSFAQERLWFLEQLIPENPAYNAPAAVRLVGSLNRKALEQSLLEIVRRHETLRTTFSMVDDKLVQVIHPLSIINYRLSVVDLQNLSSQKQDLEVQKLATTEAQRSFNLKYGPLFRTTLLQLHPEEYVLLVTMHHIVTDGWSMGLLVKEFSALYQAFSTGTASPLPELAIQYADFAQWQRQWLTGDLLETQLNYWKQQLASASFVLEILGNYPRPAINSFRGATEQFEIFSELTQQLKSLTQQQAGITLFMVLLSAFAILLERYSNQEDIIIGSPIANRRRKEIEPLIGFFANTLALRIDLSGNQTFLELLKQVQQVTVEAYAHQDIPFELLVEALHPERDMSRNPLVQVALMFQNTPMPPLALKNLTLSLLEFDSGTTRFDLEFHLWETDGKLVGKLYYYKDIFESATIVRLLDHFHTLLSYIAANPKQPISKYSLLNEKERHQLLVEWNNTTVDYPQEQCIHQLFEAQVEQTPEAIAIIFEEQQLTYRELNTKANQLALYLQTLGVKPEVLVGICVERSVEMVIGLLGILKAGGAYVPLDPAYPATRLGFMLEDAQVPVLLTQLNLKEKLPETTALVICLETEEEALSQLSRENLGSGVGPENLAYVIYTSGSTGNPKGVQIEHSSLVNFLTSMRQRLTEADVLLAITTLSFDIAALEIYLPLIVGAKIVVARGEDVTDGEKLLEKLNHNGITIMQATPTTWRLLIASGWENRHPLKMLCGGENLPSNLAIQLLERGEALWNLYGPTETTIWSTTAQVSNAISIGSPIANTQTYILDSNAQIVPIGIPGELHIGGVGLARGYKGRPEWTAEKFISNPFSENPNSRLYKTGDLARYLPDGNIEYLGRMDNQVKMRGFRIELGEIEAVLNQHPAIRETVVTVNEEQADNKRLIAYLVYEQDTAIDDSIQQSQVKEQISQWEQKLVPQLRQFLQNQLPEYMVPSTFVRLDAIPLTPNGKVDRRALEQLSVDNYHLSTEKFVAPRTAVEEIIAEIWYEILGIERVGIHDGFFTLGGHSLLVVRVVNRLQEVFSVKIAVRELFEQPTVAGIAKKLIEHEPQKGQIETIATLKKQIEQMSEEEIKAALE